MPAQSSLSIGRIREILGDKASLLDHTCKGITREQLHLPRPTYIDDVFAQTDRNPRVLGAMQRMFDTGRLAGTGYLSILPVDQGIEHSAAASFAPHPAMFDPDNIVRLAFEGGCNAVASTYGVLGSVARRWAHKIPFIVKINHNELLSYPNTFDQTMYGTVRQCFDMGAQGIGATVYWGSAESRRQLLEVAEAFAEAHSLGMFTVLWCYVRNPAFKTDKGDHQVAADLTGQANHLGVTIEADIIKQKLPEGNGGYNDPALKGLRPDHRPPDRPHPLPGRELLHGADRPHQLGRRVGRRERLPRGGHHRGHQQAGRRHGPDLGPQGVPAADEGGGRAPAGDPGRLPEQGRDRRVIRWAGVPAG
jgi:class I fructose-bisphosphate aldolase